MKAGNQKEPVAVALAMCDDYSAGSVDQAVAECLEAAGLGRRPGHGPRDFPALVPGLRLLIKPNLLMSLELACTSPAIVAAVCKWLADYGVKMTVADSPGFGRGPAVARSIGLADALRPLGLKVLPMDRPVPVKLQTHHGPALMRVSARAFECDGIISLPRVKAHSQMLVTLAVKNCFGLVCGLDKAWIHARHGADIDRFAGCIAALWNRLPPTAALADGICAMHVTGPSKGRPYPLRLVGASAFAPALDAAICAVLGIDHEASPMGRALAERMQRRTVSWPLLRPAHFNAKGFRLPAALEPPSFNPLRLAWSSLRRVAAALKTGS